MGAISILDAIDITIMYTVVIECLLFYHAHIIFVSQRKGVIVIFMSCERIRYFREYLSV